MRWVVVTGSWRKTSKQIEKDVRKIVREIIESGNGIIAGGALNVDYFATDEVIKLDPSCQKIKVFLPTTLDLYTKHYRNRANEGVITQEQAEELITQLAKLKQISPGSLIENPNNTGYS